LDEVPKCKTESAEPKHLFLSSLVTFRALHQDVSAIYERKTSTGKVYGEKFKSFAQCRLIHK